MDIFINIADIKVVSLMQKFLYTFCQRFTGNSLLLFRIVLSIILPSSSVVFNHNLEKKLLEDKLGLFLNVEQESIFRTHLFLVSPNINFIEMINHIY